MVRSKIKRLEKTSSTTSAAIRNLFFFPASFTRHAMISRMKNQVSGISRKAKILERKKNIKWERIIPTAVGIRIYELRKSKFHQSLISSFQLPITNYQLPLQNEVPLYPKSNCRSHFYPPGELLPSRNFTRRLWIAHGERTNEYRVECAA